jgi:hypothetical protein
MPVIHGSTATARHRRRASTRSWSQGHRSHVSQIRYCYEQRLATNPSLEGQGPTCASSVNGEARVAQASIAEGSTLNDPQLNACLLTRFRSWIFPAPKGGGSALVTYPVWLRPTGE